VKRLFLILGFLMLCGPTLPVDPPGNGTAWAAEDDERRLVLRAAEEEKNLESSRLIYRNPDIERYLDAVVRRLVPADRLAAAPIRVGIIRNRSCNAFIFPNGRAYIHTGMLASMENEAQLATILAHESIHALNRHMLREMRNTKEKTAWFATLGVMTGNVLLPLGQLGVLAAISGYSRDLEEEADREGLRLLVQAGYDPRESLKIFAILQREAASEEKMEPFFFASHPKLQARSENYERLLQSDFAGKTGGMVNADGYLKALALLLLDNAEMMLKAGRFEQARTSLDRYHAGSGESARAEYLLGETWRQEGKPADTEKAQEHYRKATTLDPAYADPHRALGLLAYKQKDREQARSYLERYLALAKAASDRRYIEELLKAMQQGGN